MLDENRYVITLAVAGFSQKEIDIQVENGLLTIDLVKEIPEAMKPKTIAINGKSNNDGQVLEHDAKGKNEVKGSKTS